MVNNVIVNHVMINPIMINHIMANRYGRRSAAPLTAAANNIYQLVNKYYFNK